MAAATISSTVRWNFSLRYACFPTSPKESTTPIISTGSGAFLDDDLGDGAAQTAEGAVVLTSDDGARLFDGVADGVGVDGLPRVHVDDCGGDALLFERIGGFQGSVHHDAGGDEGDVLARAHLDGFAELEVERIIKDLLVFLRNIRM